MLLATLRLPNGTTQAARREGDDLVLLPHPDAAAALAAGVSTMSGGRRVPLTGAELAPPVPHPAKIFCVGLNYRLHIAESGEQTPTYPTLFAKFARTLTGPADAIVVPAETAKLDWEAELVAVIGRPVRHAEPRTAAAAVGGFVVGNDVSVRDWQGRTSQWLQGKSFEATTPIGPYLLTADECGSAPDLRITCVVNGAVKQDSRTSDLLFGVADIVAYISTIVTLEPGDLLFTGTPGGVGQSRPTPEFLVPGDVLETTIEGIGTLRNAIVGDSRRAASSTSPLSENHGSGG